MELEFIKNVVTTDVGGFSGTIRYTVKAMYDRVHEDGYADVWFETVERFDLTRAEIDAAGGIAQVNRRLREQYGHDCLG